MTMVWEQLVYGKLVQSADGPIVPGLDYRVTGASPGYPEDVVARSHPHRTGLNTSDLFNWRNFPWNAGGGLLTRTITSSRGPMIIAGRIRGRSENGEGQPGRIYVQAHYAVTSVEQWNPAALALLPTVLSANPMTAENRVMAQLSLDDEAIRRWLDRPLEAGWIDNIAIPVAAVMSGIPFSVQDWKTSVGSFLDQCALCACAMPRALGWRLLVGAGLAEMKGDVSLALVQTAPTTGLRMVGTTVHGSDAPELASGKRYVDWLRQHASSARTAAELQALIGRLLPGFADPHAVATELDLRTTAQRIAAHVAESGQLVALEEWLNGQTEVRPDTHFKSLRSEALGLLLGCLTPRALDILPEFTTPAWTDALLLAAGEDSKVGRHAGMIARLAGLSAEAPKAEDIEFFAAEAMPVRFADRIRATLDQALNVGRLDASWAPHAKIRFGSVPWLEQWFAEREEAWLWLALDLRSRQDGRLLEALLSSGAAAPLQDLMSPEGSSAYDLGAEVLVVSAIRAHRLESLDSLFNYLIENNRVLAAIVVVEALRRRQLQVGAAQILTGSKIEDDQRRTDLARALAVELERSSREPTGSIMLRLLVDASPQLEMGPTLKFALARQLGNPYAQILIGVADPNRPPRLSPDSEKAAQLAFQKDPSLIDRLWSQLPEMDESALRNEATVPAARLLEKWITDQRALAVATPAARFAAHLVQGNGCELPDQEWTQREVAWIRKILAGKISLVSRSVGSARGLAALMNGLSIVDAMSPVYPENKELIERLIELLLNRDDRVSKLLKALAVLRWQNAPVWRLLFLAWPALYHDDLYPGESHDTGDFDGPGRLSAARRKQIDLSREETKLINQLPARQRLCLAALGVRVSIGQVFSRDSSALSRELEQFSLSSLAELAWVAHGFNAISLICTVVDILLVRVENSSTAREQLIIELSRGWPGRIKAKFAGDGVLPVVEAARDALRLLPDDERRRRELRVLSPISAR